MIRAIITYQYIEPIVLLESSQTWESINQTFKIVPVVSYQEPVLADVYLRIQEDFLGPSIFNGAPFNGAPFNWGSF